MDTINPIVINSKAADKHMLDIKAQHAEWGGGGGGGSNALGTTAGIGGNGARGEVIVITYF